MTRKDYIIIATAIGQAYAECEGKEKTGAEKVLEHIGHALQINNPDFKPGVFVRAVRQATHSLP